jgi:hypothetical protein
MICSARHRKQSRENNYHKGKEYRIKAVGKQEKTINASTVNRSI